MKFNDVEAGFRSFNGSFHRFALQLSQFLNTLKILTIELLVFGAFVYGAWKLVSELH
jgi:hypothetical protein